MGCVPYYIKRTSEFAVSVDDPDRREHRIHFDCRDDVKGPFDSETLKTRCLRLGGFQIIEANPDGSLPESQGGTPPPVARSAGDLLNDVLALSDEDRAALIAAMGGSVVAPAAAVSDGPVDPAGEADSGKIGKPERAKATTK